METITFMGLLKKFGNIRKISERFVVFYTSIKKKKKKHGAQTNIIWPLKAQELRNTERMRNQNSLITKLLHRKKIHDFKGLNFYSSGKNKLYYKKNDSRKIWEWLFKAYW